MSDSTDFKTAAAGRVKQALTSEIWIAAILFTASLAVYLRTLCPTIFSDDCGEIATAVATGGVIHPPGYPLYWLIGSLFIRLIQFGEPAWRLGLVSALAGAGAVALTYRLARRAGAGTVWAATSAMAFAFSIALWQQATKVETYALNAFFVALIFNAGAKYEETGSRRDLVLTALCCGLALTNHMTIVCALAGALWLVAAGLQRDPKPALAFAVALSASILPLSLYGAIWVSAQTHLDGQAWGDPSGLHRFFLHVTGARYHAYLMSQTGGALAQRDLFNLPALLWQNMGWFLIGVVPGIARGLWSPAARRLHQALLIAGGAYLLETSAYGILNIFEYYTPVILLLCVWSGVGMEGVVAGLSHRLSSPATHLRALQAAACTLIVLVPLFSHWSACDHSKATFIRDLALNTLKTMPKDAVLVSIGDNRIFPMWYAQEVLGVRADVTVVPRGMMESLGTPDGREEMGWLVRKLGAQHPGIIDTAAILDHCSRSSEYVRTDGPAWDIVSRSINLGHPVLIADLQPADTAPGSHALPILTRIGPNLTLSPMGLADRVVPVKGYPDLRKRIMANLEAEKQMRIEEASAPLMANEPDGNITNTLYSQMLSRTGAMLVRAADFSDAYDHFSAAKELNPTPANIGALAYVCVRTRRTAEAIDMLNEALALDPGNAELQRDLHDDEEMERVASNRPPIGSH